jgi:hypothetical protein
MLELVVSLDQLSVLLEKLQEQMKTRKVYLSLELVAESSTECWMRLVLTDSNVGGQIPTKSDLPITKSTI